MRFLPRRTTIEPLEDAPPASPSMVRRSVRSLLVLLVISSLGIAWRPLLGEGYDSLIFVVGITIIGALEGVNIALVCAALAALIFNFFISEPILQLNFEKSSDFAPPVVFAICAIVSGFLSGRMHDQSLQMQQSNEKLETLLDASRKLQQANSEENVFSALVDSAGSALGLELGLYRLAGVAPEKIGASPDMDDWLAVVRRLAAGDDGYLRRGGLAGWLLKGNAGAVGVLVANADGVELDDSFMLALAHVTALALARTQLSSQLADARAHVRADELKSALLASVSHDLRSPLTAINASAASLLAFGDGFDRDTMRELLGGIVEETDRLSMLTTNLLEMGRLEAGEIQLHRSVLPAAEIIRNTVDRHRRLAGDRTLTFTAPRVEVLIEVDAVLFDLVLTNVLQNAIRYTPPDGVIAVACSVEGLDCMIIVTDDGIGIPVADQGKVFERFYRVARSGEVPRGSGLGLAIARSFVEASLGSIAIISPIRDGRGTTVSIRLPVAVCALDERALTAAAMADDAERG